jgi:hypothetical protein
MHRRTPHFYIRGYSGGRAVITHKHRRKTAAQKVEYAIFRMFGVKAAREYRAKKRLGGHVVGPASSFKALRAAARGCYRYRAAVKVR